MQQEQKKRISVFMDGELIDHDSIDKIVDDVKLHQCWHRYHVTRNAIRGTLHDCTLNFDLSKQIAESIQNEPAYSIDIPEQPHTRNVVKPNLNAILWDKTKNIITKFGQVGLAACVTLAIISGVQYYQETSNRTDMPLLNTVPVGVSVSPVGGLPQKKETQSIEPDDTMRLLLQDYELQKRLNTHKLH